MKQAVESLDGTVEEKLKTINETIESQTTALSGKLAAIQGSLDAGLVGEDSTLGLVKKAIDALNSTAGTANEKLDAIKDAINSPTSGLNVKLEAIREALAQGLIDVTQKQDLILAAINSGSTYHFTKDELLETGEDYLLVDAAFWNANHENYEVVRALKELIKLSLPNKYRFYFQQSSGGYPLSGSENTSFYGPLYTEGGILHSIRGMGELILAIDIQNGSTVPDYTNINGHLCYYIKKVYKSAYYLFHVKIGARASGKKLKMESIGNNDTFRQESEQISFEHWAEAIKATSNVWGFNGLKYNPSSPKDGVNFIIVEDN